MGESKSKIIIYNDSKGNEFGRLYSLKPKECPNGHILYGKGKDVHCWKEDCEYGFKD